MITRTAKIGLVFLLLVSAGCMETDIKILDFGSDKISQTYTLTVYGNTEWSVTSTESWVTVNPDKAQVGGTYTINVSVDRTGLDPGSYETTLTISNNLNTPSAHIQVKMTVALPQQLTLTIDKVGDGSITSDVTGIDCGDDCSDITDDDPGIDCSDDCSENYTQGTTVILTATETSSDYKFYAFSGCDSETANTCTVTMDKARMVFATFTKEIVLQEATKIIDVDIMQYFVKQDDSTYYFDPQVSNLIQFTPGDILASIVDQGFLRKVTAVYQTADNLIAVETEQATLEDAIKEGTIVLTKKLTHSDLSSPPKLMKGATLRKPVDPDSTEFTIDFDNVDIMLPDKDVTMYESNEAWNTGRDFKYGFLSGSITLTIEPDFACDIGCTCAGHKCKSWWCARRPWRMRPAVSFRAVVKTTNINTLKISLIGAGSNTNIGPFKVANLPLGCVTAGPVVLCPVVQLYVGGNGSAQGSLGAGITETNTFTIGVNHKKSGGWSAPDPNLTHTFTWNPPTFTAAASIKGYIQPNIVILIYDVVGPYFGLQPYLRFNADFVPPKSQWGLFGGITGKVGVKAEIFGFDLGDYSTDVFNYEEKLASGSLTTTAKITTTTTSVSTTTTSRPTTSTTQPTTTTTQPQQGRFHDNNNGTVTDTKTGLIWLKNANPCYGKIWDDAGTYCSSLSSGTAGLTDGSVAGQWRLPSVQELEGIGTDPPTTYCLDGTCWTCPITWTTPGAPFTGVVTEVVYNHYWSSTRLGWSYNGAWAVDILSGNLLEGNTGDTYYVWPVRGGNATTTTTVSPSTTTTILTTTTTQQTTSTTQPTTSTTQPTTTTTANQRFVDNNNGTVTDTITGLIWLKNANASGGMIWDSAMSYCSNLASGQAGLTDGSVAGQWRLPTKEEFQGIGTNPPATWESGLPSVTWTMPGAPFMNVQTGYHWSSTTDVSDTRRAWLVSMGWGNTYSAFKASAGPTPVWPVRGGNATTTTTIPTTTTTTSIRVPSAPTNLNAVVDLFPLPSSVELTWQDNSDNEFGFRIMRQVYLDPMNIWVMVAEVGPNITTYSDLSIDYNTYYVYYVQAYNEGLSAISNSVLVDVGEPTV